MVDIHSHILWGLDDGAKSLDESVAMLEAAAASGTVDIVATPHANSAYSFEPDTIADRVAELNARPETLPRIHTGCDFHLSFGNIRTALEDPYRFTIDHLNYLMVEFPDFSIPAAIDSVFAEFVSAGITPVITHPERNEELMRDVPRLTRWVHQGCLIQVTAGSLSGGFGSRAKGHGWDLIRAKLVHAVASDAHDPVHRHPRLDGARREVAKRIGEADADCLFDRNPAAIVAGRPPDEISSIQGVKRGWQSLFR